MEKFKTGKNTMKFFNKLKNIFFIIKLYFTSEQYFGFIQGSSINSKYLSLEKNFDDQIVINFEKLFSKIIGNGSSIAFAAGRMAFFALLKAISIEKGDEVILLGSTCSVMSNAVIRCGAIPVYSDVDINTFGSEVNSIKIKITSKTKVIVAQHSFGIPCDIQPIVDLAKEKGIFLVEDCALTLGSMINNIKVGNFGDAAIFSFDHSKPINLLLGGIVYTENNTLLNKIRKIQNSSQNFSNKKINIIYNQLHFENKYCNPKFFVKYLILNRLKRLKYAVEDDFVITKNEIKKPYLVKFPTFLAQYGIHLILEWENTEKIRVENLKLLLNYFSKSKYKEYLPKSYYSESTYIVPLRFVWSQPNGDVERKKLSKLIHVEWTWFLKPIISTNKPLKEFYYKIGDSPISEKIGNGMVNLPCNLSIYETKILIEKFNNLI